MTLCEVQPSSNLCSTFLARFDQFQSNTTQHFKVISSLWISKQIVKDRRHPWKITWRRVRITIKQLIRIHNSIIEVYVYRAYIHLISRLVYIIHVGTGNIKIEILVSQLFLQTWNDKGSLTDNLKLKLVLLTFWLDAPILLRARWT